jgi:hypothetical protein
LGGRDRVFEASLGYTKRSCLNNDSDDDDDDDKIIFLLREREADTTFYSK